MNIRLFITFLTVLLSPLLIQAQQINVERIWTGKNGNTFKGNFIAEVDGKYEFFSSTLGKNLVIAPENISAKDIAWLQAQREVLEAPAHPKVISPSDAFKAAPVVNRMNIPIINQADYGNKANDCVPSTICNYLLWWDEINFLKIDRRGRFDRKAEYVHDTLGRSFKTRNNSGTNVRQAISGIREYFDKDYKGALTYQICRTLGASPKMMSHYASGINAVALELTVFHGNKQENRHWVALVKAEPNGSIVFNTWGKQFKGTVTPTKDSIKPASTQGYREVADQDYQINISDNQLMNWMQENEVNFRILQCNTDGLFVLIPAIYKQGVTKGSPEPFPKSDGDGMAK